ncbi:hypothetical protein F2Q70_00003783 [Brassica cretica]|uniref:Uncharacterized protein n=1 Tax=Brassica cretica TaxID=69181 RepID=A0A8S9IY09_BRACR|nr:hypothetical protein F2Q70_00003783 [Brassica cretica]
MNYGSSYYQKPPPPTQESKIEEMLDRVLEAQQRMTVDFSGKEISRSNFNQNSQYQKPYNISYNNNMNYGSSYYQKPPPPTQESKIEEMLDRVLEAQQRMTVDFSGKEISSPNRSTGTPEHRSTTPTESTASCNAVKILTHEEFAVKHPHPPSPDKVIIDRRADTSIDRHGESSID